MNRHYTLYAWHLSYFAGKLRAYFIYKKVPFNEIPVSYYMLTGPVQRNTGARVMPTITTPEGCRTRGTSSMNWNRSSQNPPSSPPRRDGASLPN